MNFLFQYSVENVTWVDFDSTMKRLFPNKPSEQLINNINNYGGHKNFVFTLIDDINVTRNKRMQLVNAMIL